MFGLIRNNFYAVGSSLKWMVGSYLVIIVLSIISNMVFPAQRGLLLGAMGGIFGGICGLSSAISKDVKCKWNTYEIILPIRRSDVIKARYITILMYALISMFCVTTIVGVWNLLGSEIVAEEIGNIYTFGFMLMLVVPTSTFLLALKFGFDKNELFLMFTLGFSIVLYFSTFISGGKMQYDKTALNIGVCIISILVFVAAYCISIYVNNRKEF